MTERQARGLWPGGRNADRRARGRMRRTDRGAPLRRPRRCGRDGRRGRTTARAGQARAAFDLLHLRHATAFTRQTYLLSGNPGIAERAVAHAFRTAWERWPEVAVDSDPAGWVRAVAHDYALSPWHRFVPGRRTRARHPGPPADRALLAGLLTLPRPYRRCLLLHDGLGVGLAATAAETEASTAAAHGRLTHAREALAERVPELRNARAERRGRLLADRLGLLLASATVRPPPPAAQVRAGCERFTRRFTGAAYALTLAVTAAVGASLATAEPWAEPPPDDDAVAPAVAPSAAPGPGADAGRGPGDDGDDGDGPAYVPELRSSNARMRLVRPGDRPSAEPQASRHRGHTGR